MAHTGTETAFALDLTTEMERRPIQIDGATYYLRDSDELTLGEQIRLGNIGKRYEGLADSLDALDDAEVAALSEQIDWATRTALHGVPDEVFARLRDSHKMAIVSAFSVGLQQSDEDAAQNLKPSLVSPVSTVSTPSGS